MQQVKQAGIPLVFVSMSGSAVAFPWEAENADAILQAWYGGQAAGTAVADILWGDCNPSGRLPVTFYAGDDQLPDFNDYSMKGRTYRYFEGRPLYPFGYGLSYTTFAYDAPVCTAKTAVTGEPVKIATRVRNTGSAAGDEVVQLYISHPDGSATQADPRVERSKTHSSATRRRPDRRILPHCAGSRAGRRRRFRRLQPGAYFVLCRWFSARLRNGPEATLHRDTRQRSPQGASPVTIRDDKAGFERGTGLVSDHSSQAMAGSSSSKYSVLNFV